MTCMYTLTLKTIPYSVSRNNLDVFIDRIPNGYWRERADLTSFIQVFMTLFHIENKNAKHFLDLNGRSTQNGGSWQRLHEDMKEFLRGFPGILVMIEEIVPFPSNPENFYQARHYFQDELSSTLRPNVTWPTSI